jgi:hypothetical protein
MQLLLQPHILIIIFSPPCTSLAFCSPIIILTILFRVLDLEPNNIDALQVQSIVHTSVSFDVLIDSYRQTCLPLLYLISLLLCISLFILFIASICVVL